MSHQSIARNASGSSLSSLRTVALALIVGLVLALGATHHPAAPAPAGALGPAAEGTAADSNSADEVDLGAVALEPGFFSDSNSADDVDLG